MIEPTEEEIEAAARVIQLKRHESCFMENQDVARQTREWERDKETAKAALQAAAKVRDNGNR